MKFVAVGRIGLMTHHECCIDHLFLYHVTGVGCEPSPPLKIQALGGLFKLTFWCLTLSSPKRCHMDLWLAWLVLTHHHLHQHHQLPSATFPRDRVNSSFLLVVFFCGKLQWAQIDLECRRRKVSFLKSPYLWSQSRYWSAVFFKAPWW